MHRLKLLLSALFLLVFLKAGAIHIIGGQFSVRQLDTMFFEVQFELIYEPSFGFPGPIFVNQVQLNLNGHNNGTRIPIESRILNVIQIDTANINQNCLQSQYPLHKSYFLDTFSIPIGALTYSDGVSFLFENCCLSPQYSNSSPGNPISMEMFFHLPNLVGLFGTAQNFPFWSFLPEIKLCTNYNNFIDYSGFDADGDSLVYEFFSYQSTSQNSTPLIAGTSSFDGVIPSFPPMFMDPASGLVTGKPSNQGLYLVGQKLREFRNGTLISENYRLLPNISKFCPSANFNQATSELGNSGWVNASNVGGQVLATEGQVEIPFNTIESDTNNLVRFGILSNSIRSSDLALQSNSLLFNSGQDTLSNKILIDLSQPVSVDTLHLITIDTNCVSQFQKTLSIPIQFQNVSDAGNSNTVLIDLDTANDMALLPLLKGTPRPGGTWFDFSSSGFLSGGIFLGSQVTSPAAYKLIYQQQEPNYPIDTATLTLIFFDINGVSDKHSNDFFLYPNPATTSISVEGSDLAAAIFLDVTGALLLRAEATKRSKIDLDVSEVKNGIYLLELVNLEGDKFTRRVIIRH